MANSVGTWLSEVLIPGAAAVAAMGNIRALANGKIVFTEGGGSGVIGNWGILDPSTGVVTEIAAPVASTMGGICDTGDGRVAYSLSSAASGVVCNLDGSGSHSVAWGGAGSGEPILGPDGAIWYAGAGGAQIKSISLSTYAVLQTIAAAGPPHSMTVGGDNRLWASALNAAQANDGLWAVTTAGVATFYQNAAKYLHPSSTQGCRYNPADGKIYYTRGPGRCTIGRCTTGGVFDPEWAVQVPFATPTGITFDSAGNIWVACRGANKVECYDLTGKRLVSVTCPTAGNHPNKITYANGLIYVTYWTANKIGVIQAV